MSKTISSDLQDHLNEEVTTLCRMWRITRTDGDEFFFTDHDADLVFESNTYIAMEGFSATAVTTNASLDVDNLNVMGIFQDESIDEDEIAAGLFDYAEVRLFVVNWADLTQGSAKMRRGWFGEAIKSPSGIFKVELRGLTQILAQSIGEIYGPECRADLGDSRCKVPIDPPLIARNTLYAVGDYVKIATDTGASGYAQYENRIYKATTAGVTDSVLPTFDTTVGNQTGDGGTDVATTTSTYTAAGANFTAGDRVTIDDFTYIFVASLVSSSPGNVLIDISRDTSMSNLFNAITLGPGAGTKYNIDTPANNAVTVTHPTAATLIVALADFVIPGQYIVLSELSNGAWSSSTLGVAVSDVTTANPVVFEAVQAWSRNFVVTAVTDRRLFNITVSDARAIDGWFDGGVVIFETGDNPDRGFEIKTWVASGGIVTLWLPVGFAIQVGDTGRLYPGCDKRLTTCRDRFDNLLNMRAEPYLPGRDAVLSYPDPK